MNKTDLTEITVIGDDDTGLIAHITSLLFKRGINIEDLDQEVHDGVFRMTMHVDTTEMETTEADLRSDLCKLGQDLDVDIQVRFPTNHDTQNLAILVTKESHCLERLCEAVDAGNLNAKISVIIGNYPELQPIAKEYGIPFHDIGDEEGNPDEEQLLDLLANYDADLVVLARYMRILSPNVVFRYKDRIINIHPSLLPAFPGAKAYRQAKEAGVRIAGVTAHYVTPALDQGPIITQRAFDVPDGTTIETLRDRGQPLEAEALLEAVRLHINDDMTVQRNQTQLRESTETYQLGLSQ